MCKQMIQVHHVDGAHFERVVLILGSLKSTGNREQAVKLARQIRFCEILQNHNAVSIIEMNHATRGEFLFISSL